MMRRWCASQQAVSAGRAWMKANGSCGSGGHGSHFCWLGKPGP
jgi:hypothetical protein